MFMISMTAALLLQASPVDVLVDNALEVSTSQGSYITYFNADGTYTTNIGVEGSWHVEGDNLCVQRSTGEGGCAPMQPGLEAGASWQNENPTTGETVTYTIITRD